MSRKSVKKRALNRLPKGLGAKLAIVTPLASMTTGAAATSRFVSEYTAAATQNNTTPTKNTRRPSRRPSRRAQVRGVGVKGGNVVVLPARTPAARLHSGGVLDPGADVRAGLRIMDALSPTLTPTLIPTSTLKVFRCFDRDNNGKLDANELGQLLNRVFPEKSDENGEWVRGQLQAARFTNSSRMCPRTAAVPS